MEVHSCTYIYPSLQDKNILLLRQKLEGRTNYCPDTCGILPFVFILIHNSTGDDYFNNNRKKICFCSNFSIQRNGKQ